MTTKTKRTDFSRLDWQRQAVGRITVASGATTAKELAARHAILDRLYDAGQFGTLRALKLGPKKGGVTMRELVAADRDGRLLHADLLGDIHLRKSLWGTLEATIPKLGRQESTRDEYRSVLHGFAKRNVLPRAALLGDLLAVDWRGTVRPLYGKPANWNHLRRFLSAALTQILGDVHHPARRAFIKAFGKMEKEPKGKTVVFSEAQLARFLAELPEVIRPGALLMAATGIRCAEYLSARPEGYDAETGTLRVIAKGGNERWVIVPEEARPWTRAALPYPWSYRSLYNQLKKAFAAIGRAEMTPHDLRHAAALFSIDQGAGIHDVKEMLGHEDIQTTMRYLHTSGRRAASKAVGKILARVLPAAPAHIGPGGVVQPGTRSDGSPMPGFGTKRRGA